MATLLVCLVSVTLLYVTLMVFRTRLEWLRDENRVLEERRSLEVGHV